MEAQAMETNKEEIQQVEPKQKLGGVRKSKSTRKGKKMRKKVIIQDGNNNNNNGNKKSLTIRINPVAIEEFKNTMETMPSSSEPNSLKLKLKPVVSSRKKSWSKITKNFEKFYEKQVELEFKSQVDKKLRTDTWTSFYKRLFKERAEVEAREAKTDAILDEIDIESPSFRIPPVRISPTFWENRQKYGL